MRNNRPILLLLCFFFGLLGVHRLYEGKIKTGLIMLFTFGGFGIWYLLDLLTLILQKPVPEKKKRASLSRPRRVRT